MKTHVLRKTDTLAQLSAAYGVPVCMIVRANPGFCGLRPGRTLRIPEPDYCAACTHTYVLTPEDTVFSLSAKFSVPMDSILRANGLHRPDELYGRQSIQIPQRQCRLYTAGATDTITTVCEKFGISEQELRECNHIFGGIFNGLQLWIPHRNTSPHPHT